MSKGVDSRESLAASTDERAAPLTTHDARLTASLARRHRAERRFQAYGLAALGFAGFMLCVLLYTVAKPGLNGFTRHELQLQVPTHATTDYYALTNEAVVRAAAGTVPRHQALTLVGTFAAFDVKHALATPAGDAPTRDIWVPLSSNADMLLKGTIARSAEAGTRALTDSQIAVLDAWRSDGKIRRSMNWEFFRRGDSRAPEAAGFLGSIVGSLFTLLICLLLAVPIAIMAAITLEEFAKKTRIAEWLEITINNLAAVPSIIYGLLGLSVFLQVLHAPRSSALAGGLTLAILILPVMIIAARSAIRAVPPSMRQAATALGATPLQVVRRHVLPYALPGIMTGTILSICRALGETAPLLMIGMVAFVADIPRGVSDPATSMPVEIYLWASSPELGFIEKTSSGILVLLVILLLLNALAIRLRNRSQLTWN